MTAAKKCVGFCLLCGGDIRVDPALEDPWQDAEAWILGTTTHNCEPGRILQEHGSDALDAWQAKQPKDPSMQRYENMSFDEYIDALVAEAEAKASPLTGPGTDLASPSPRRNPGR
jgi:hypothetical protein